MPHLDQPSIFRKDLWAQQQERLMEVLSHALALLVQGEPMPDPDEEEITRRLAICCRKISFRLDKEGRGIAGELHWETKDLAQYMDTGIPVKEVKKPDCQYAFRDQQASRWEDHEKSLTIECKRLGRYPNSPHTRKSILNQDYVKDGIRRFIDESHSYGKTAPHGIMIGYVQNMDLDDILAEVNAECKAHKIPELTLFAQGWQVGLVSHLDHQLIRAFPITSFVLRHMWTDLRAHYVQP